MSIEIVPGYVRDDQLIRDICSGSNEPEWLVASACKVAMSKSSRCTDQENARLILIGLGRLARAASPDTVSVIRQLMDEFIPLEDELFVMVRECASEIENILQAGPEWETGTIEMLSCTSRRDDCESVYHLVLLQGSMACEGAKLLNELDRKVITYFSVPRPQFCWAKYGGPTELDQHTRRNDPEAWWVREECDACSDADHMG